MIPTPRRRALVWSSHAAALRVAADRARTWAATLEAGANRIACRVRGHGAMLPERVAGRPVYQCVDCGYARPRVGPVLVGRQWH